MPKKKRSNQKTEKRVTQESAIMRFQEWQANQYMPGYYVGANTHPMFTSKNKFVGWMLIVIGGSWLIASFMMLSSVMSHELEDGVDALMTVLAVLIPFLFGSLAFWGGVQNLRSKR